jgi:DNA-binding NarL/FixJ family response regulator
MRVCVVDSPELGPAYPRLAECALECMAVVPSIDQVDPRLLGEHEAVLVACSENELADPSFQAAVARIARQLPTIALVTAGADAAVAARLGFRGLLGRDVSPTALERTVRAVLLGEIAFPRSSQFGTVRSQSAFPWRPGNGDAPTILTPRQQQIVDLIAQGSTDREIAGRLRISQSTAHKHVQNALRRSNTRTRSQLVAVVRQTALQ